MRNIQKYVNKHFDSFFKIFHLCAANCAVSTLNRYLHLHDQCDNLCDHDGAADDDEDDDDGEDDEDEDDIG